MCTWRAFSSHLWESSLAFIRLEMLFCTAARQAPCTSSDCFAVDIFEIMQRRICAVWWKEWTQTFKVTPRLVMKTHRAQKMCLGMGWRQCCVQSNYSQEHQFPVQTSSDCIYSRGILESRGLFNFWYTLMTFPAGEISRRQERGLEMAISCPQWNCTCWVQTWTWGEECPTFGACPLHLCLKGKKADRSVINQSLRKQDCGDLYPSSVCIVAVPAAWWAPWRGCSLMGWDWELYSAETAQGGEVATGGYRPPLPIFCFCPEEKRGEEMGSTVCWYKQKANL